jgi:GNAT superfamily N-acetyltransferase
VRLVRELALYEREAAERVRLTEEDVVRDGFGERPRFKVLLVEIGDEPVGFALFFENYSTWEGRPGIYVEDLFLEERARGLGLGRELLAEIARIAETRGCLRIDLAVLDWNPTREFYDRLGFEKLPEWNAYRLTQPGIAKLANRVRS